MYLRELETLKHVIIEERGFRGGVEVKMRRMWLGREIDVADLLPLVYYRQRGYRGRLTEKKHIIKTPLIIHIKNIRIYKCSFR